MILFLFNNKTDEIEKMQQLQIQLNTSKFLKLSGKAKGLDKVGNHDSFFSDELKNVIKAMVKKAKFNFDQVGEVNKEGNGSGSEFKKLKVKSLISEKLEKRVFSLNGFAKKLVGGNDKIKSAVLAAKENSLNKLDSDKNDMEDVGMLAVSVLPFIESMLSLFGLNHQQIQDVLTDINTDNQEMNLSELLKNLKEVMGECEQPADFLIKKGSFGQLISLLQGMDIAPSLKGKSTFSLEEFAKELEKKNGFGEKNSIEFNIEGGEKKRKATDNIGMANVLNGKNSKKNESEILQWENRQHKRDNIEQIDKADNKNILDKKDFLANHGREENKEVVKNSEVKNIKESGGFNKFIKTTEETEPVKNDSNLKTVSEENIVSGIKGKTVMSVSGKTDEKPMPSYLLNQVTKQISRSVKMGDKDVEFTIKPPHLGRVRLGLENSVNGLKVSILAENKITKDILLSNVADLKAVLLEIGVKLEKVEVLFASNFNQFSDSLKQDHNRKFAKNREQKIGAKQKQRISQDVDEKQVYARKKVEGGLDLVA